MEDTFENANKVNVDISKWNISKVTSMSSMFGLAKSFNQPLVSDVCCWNVSNVKDMGFMFHTAILFNQNINSWEINCVEKNDVNV
jgi:surface protein